MGGPPPPPPAAARRQNFCECRVTSVDHDHGLMNISLARGAVAHHCCLLPATGRAGLQITARWSPWTSCSARPLRSREGRCVRWRPAGSSRSTRSSKGKPPSLWCACARRHVLRRRPRRAAGAKIDYRQRRRAAHCVAHALSRSGVRGGMAEPQVPLRAARERGRAPGAGRGDLGRGGAVLRPPLRAAPRRVPGHALALARVSSAQVTVTVTVTP
jgi:hypothetical protein